MRKFLIAILALGLAATALANNGKEPVKNPPGAYHQETQNVETKDRKTLTARGGGLLNTETTPEQARKVAEATNRQILQRRSRR